MPLDPIIIFLWSYPTLQDALSKLHMHLTSNIAKTSYWKNGKYYAWSLEPDILWSKWYWYISQILILSISLILLIFFYIANTISLKLPILIPFMIRWGLGSDVARSDGWREVVWFLFMSFFSLTVFSFLKFSSFSKI